MGILLKKKKKLKSTTLFSFTGLKLSVRHQCKLGFLFYLYPSTLGSVCQSLKISTSAKSIKQIHLLIYSVLSLKVKKIKQHMK